MSNLIDEITQADEDLRAAEARRYRGKQPPPAVQARAACLPRGAIAADQGAEDRGIPIPAPGAIRGQRPVDQSHAGRTPARAHRVSGIHSLAGPPAGKAGRRDDASARIDAEGSQPETQGRREVRNRPWACVFAGQPTSGQEGRVTTLSVHEHRSREQTHGAAILLASNWSGRGSNPQPQHCERWGSWRVPGNMATRGCFSVR